MKRQSESIAAIKRQIRAYQAQSQSQHGFAKVKITTARALESQEYEAIAAKIKKEIGRELLLEKQVNPAIIGGLIVQVGDNILDGSVVRRLKEYSDFMISIDAKKIGVTNAV